MLAARLWNISGRRRWESPAIALAESILLKLWELIKWFVFETDAALCFRWPWWA
jgi:hypothetical protein